MMIAVIHRWERGLCWKAWWQWGAVIAMLREQEIHRKAFELFERQCRHVLRWRIWQGWSDWQAHTEYSGGYTAESEPVRWFWATVRAYSQEDLRKTLAFVTGSESVGPGGFAELPGYQGGQRRFGIRPASAPAAAGAAVDNELPRAQTCFNTLMLPAYSSEAGLAAKLRQAIEEGAAGFDEGAVAS